MTRMIEGFFWVGKFWQVCFFFGGGGWYSKLMFHVMLSGNFYGLEIRRGILEG